MARKSQAEKVYDRVSRDLPINSRIAISVVKDPAGDQITVARSLRDDPLGGLYARNQIDTAKFHAGRRWQRFHEESEIGSIRAIDPSKEAVDGGRFYAGLTDEQMYAAGKFSSANEALGYSGAALVMDILGRRMGISEAAARRGYVTLREREFVAARFRECLETLAVHFGYAPKRRGLL